MVLETVHIVQPVQRVVVVEIVQEVTEMVLPVITVTGNATFGYANATGTAFRTGFAMGTGNGRFPLGTGTAASGYGVHHSITANASSGYFATASAASSGAWPLPYHLTHLPDGPWDGVTRT